MRQRALGASGLSLTVFLLTCASAFAQGGSLSGVVVDANGGMIPGSCDRQAPQASPPGAFSGKLGNAKPVNFAGGRRTENKCVFRSSGPPVIAGVASDPRRNFKRLVTANPRTTDYGLRTAECGVRMARPASQTATFTRMMMPIAIIPPL